MLGGEIHEAPEGDAASVNAISGSVSNGHEVRLLSFIVVGVAGARRPPCSFLDIEFLVAWKSRKCELWSSRNSQVATSPLLPFFSLLYSLLINILIPIRKCTSPTTIFHFHFFSLKAPYYTTISPCLADLRSTSSVSMPPGIGTSARWAESGLPSPLPAPTSNASVSLLPSSFVNVSSTPSPARSANKSVWSVVSRLMERSVPI